MYTHANQDYDKNTVYAFDKSVARSQLLSDRMVAAGALNVSVQNYDFLEVDADADEYSNVRFLLLDPSCSGKLTVISSLTCVLQISFVIIFLVCCRIWCCEGTRESFGN